MIIGIDKGFEDGFTTFEDEGHIEDSHFVDGAWPSGVEHNANNLYDGTIIKPLTCWFITQEIEKEYVI